MSIWIDEENVGVNVPPSSAKRGLSTFKSVTNTMILKQSAKKNVLGNLDNLLHNKQNATPFRGNQNKPLLGPKASGAKSSASKSTLCTDTLRKEQRKQNFKDAKSVLKDQYKPPEMVAIEKMDPSARTSASPSSLVDAFDFPSAQCLSQCHKNKTDMWAMNDCWDDDFIDQLCSNDPKEEIDFSTGKQITDLADDDLALPPLLNLDEDDIEDQFERTVCPLPDMISDFDFSF